jgi:hypothetical protein
MNNLNFNYKLHIRANTKTLNEEVLKAVSQYNKDLLNSLNETQDLEHYLLNENEKIMKNEKDQISQIIKLKQKEVQLNEPFVGLLSGPELDYNQTNIFNKEKTISQNEEKGKNVFVI